MFVYAGPPKGANLMIRSRDTKSCDAVFGSTRSHSPIGFGSGRRRLPGLRRANLETVRKRAHGRRRNLRWRSLSGTHRLRSRLLGGIRRSHALGRRMWDGLP